VFELFFCNINSLSLLFLSFCIQTMCLYYLSFLNCRVNSEHRFIFCVFLLCVHNYCVLFYYIQFLCFIINYIVRFSLHIITMLSSSLICVVRKLLNVYYSISVLHIYFVNICNILVSSILFVNITTLTIRKHCL
jgi:hypothetical protein